MKPSSKKSAGLLLFRRKKPGVEVFLVHMGGPFWAHKDDGAWSIPKGEFTEEAPLDAAVREFKEETGLTPTGDFLELAPAKQPSGKTVFAWALEWDCDATKIKSNTFAMEWPKGSGVMQDFPEVDRASWFSLGEARKKLLKGQIPFIDQFERALAGASGGGRVAPNARPTQGARPGGA
jgi:predicted NUDIX family NTP pyrophosphohydrolase